ncbi:DNA recombination protein RmuC [Echinicola jeungdonensis]|uniref:DNA recombination protein RmuC n=1 Tax=Echinicola jeungdonensis TaxID=709343 RepID=A0ABV5J318_9BACT|nr:DNA recombination protein RmuC [Echinicola jeungdonensis]MDN3670566.1 DNA recombination protein RmuC [Echinicola jeungdonensis]
MEDLILGFLIVNAGLMLFLIWKVSNGKSLDKTVTEHFDVLKMEFSRQMSENRGEINQSIQQQFQMVFDTLRANSKDQNESLRDFGKLFRENVRDFNELQREKFRDLERRQEKMLQSTEERLEKMRETVDEKLQKTLETRLGQSFEVVSKQLQAVQKGLGEMQHLATGVGDLKKVLSNVKSRGVLGEYQLESILENILAPDQFDRNAAMKSNSAERVEFAVRLPGNNADEPVFLPIDAKFPQDAYHRLLDAYETGDRALTAANKVALYKAVKKSAQDIHQKYINPPYTTDFAVMFLPMESLYAEIIRDAELTQTLQREYKVVVTGPTTLAAMLNSLQLGFKTLAIQKRSSEVWQVLGAVKTEFGKFGNLIQKAQKKLNEANNDLDSLVGARTRVIQRKLKDIEELPEKERSKLLGD